MSTDIQHPPALSQSAQIALCSGIGKYATDKKDTLQPVTLEEIEALLLFPTEVDKDAAQWVIFSDLMSREYAKQRERGRFYALWADLDEQEGLTIKTTAEKVAFVIPDRFHVYASRSATETNQKARVIVPLAEPVSGADFVKFQQIFNEKLAAQGLTPDTKNEGAGQICYLPNKGEFYGYITVEHTGQGFTPSQSWGSELEAIKQQEEAANQAAEARKAQAIERNRQRAASGTLSPIQAFNEATDLEYLMQRHDYQKIGRRWLPPESTSGSPGVTVKGDRWVSSHDCDRGKGVEGVNGSSGDAFDLFCYYEHGGDRKAALEAAGAMFTTTDGLTISQANQQKHMQQQAQAEPVEGFSWLDNPQPAKPEQTGEAEPLLDLARFSLRGQSAKMKAKMLEDKFILGRMAILGQATVFYAKPNVGKTLLTLWLLMEAVRSGDIKGEDVFYINADDNHKGLTEKNELVEDLGIHMLAPGYNGFRSDQLPLLLATLAAQGTARGKVLILDTVKKFTDLMDKKKGSEFMECVRQFVSHGGTVIMLAHVNKKRDDEGKVVFAGTSDLVDDADCAYILDEVTTNALSGEKTVKFENFKSRGDVASEEVYKYAAGGSKSYHERLASVEIVSDKDRKEAERQRVLETILEANRDAIDAIKESLNEHGEMLKTELIKDACERSGVSRAKIMKALKDHTGKNLAENQFWFVDIQEKNGHKFKLNWFSS